MGERALSLLTPRPHPPGDHHPNPCACHAHKTWAEYRESRRRADGTLMAPGEDE